MKSITLITPPSTFLLDERMFLNLGILKVASSLEQRGWIVFHLDLSGYKNFGKVVADYVRNTECCIFGITATSPQLPAAVEIAAAIRSVYSEARIILGGPHVTLVYAAKKVEIKESRPGRAHRAAERLEEIFDFLVAGDGEEAIFVACKVSKNSLKLIDADGFKENGTISPLFLTPIQLEASTFPARHLVDLDSYNFKIDGVRASSIIAQLGCPFECGFCAGRNSPTLRHIRTRSADAVIEEMVHMYQNFGIRGFMFYDDEQNLVNKEFIELLVKITRKQRELGVEWRLRGNVKSQLFNEEQAQAMYEAGYRKVLIGFESGSPRILSNIRKRATREENTRCLEIARKYKLEVKALMSFGHPGESEDTIDETRQWLLFTKPHEIDFSIITPYPGSPYYDNALPTGQTREGKEEFVYTCKDKWNGEADRLYQVELDYVTESDYYKGDPNALVISHVWTDYLSPEDLVRGRNQVEAETRGKLGVPYYRRSEPIDCEAINFGHSMGQTPILSSRMFRVSHQKEAS